MNKEYNPLKMKGPYIGGVGFLALLCRLLFVAEEIQIYALYYLYDLVDIIRKLATSASCEGLGCLGNAFNFLFSSIIVFFIIGFLVGWAIELYIKAYKKTH